MGTLQKGIKLTQYYVCKSKPTLIEDNFTTLVTIFEFHSVHVTVQNCIAVRSVLLA